MQSIPGKITRSSSTTSPPSSPGSSSITSDRSGSLISLSMGVCHEVRNHRPILPRIVCGDLIVWSVFSATASTILSIQTTTACHLFVCCCRFCAINRTMRIICVVLQSADAHAKTSESASCQRWRPHQSHFLYNLRSRSCFCDSVRLLSNVLCLLPVFVYVCLSGCLVCVCVFGCLSVCLSVCVWLSCVLVHLFLCFICCRRCFCRPYLKATLKH